MSESVQKWLERKMERPDGTVASINTKFASLEVGVHKQLAADARKMCPAGASIMIVCDEKTERYVEPVERALVDEGFVVKQYKAPNEPDGSPPAPEESSAILVQQELEAQGIAMAVAVGSGTINDRAKYAAHLAEIPYMSYGTAASMNGYNSPIVAIYVKGLKSTVPATPPIGLYADPEVVVQAPRLMHLAGLGDLCSKPFAGADALIASLLTQNPAWRFPSEMVEEAFAQSLEQAEAIGQDDPVAIANLMEALWISGFSMVLAGSSAPASGGEHLWSHRIDMAQHDAGQPLRALHGTQVGIACHLVKPLFGQLAACSHDELLMQLDKEHTQPPDPANEKTFTEWLTSRHTELSDKSRKPLVKEAIRKYDRAYRAQIREGLRTQWTAVQRELEQAHHHATRVAEALSLAGAPQSPEDIGLSNQDSTRILTVCRDIRNRLTILDLTAEVFGEAGFSQK